MLESMENEWEPRALTILAKRINYNVEQGTNCKHFAM